MKNRILSIVLILCAQSMFSQEIDSDLLSVKNRLDSIVEYSAEVALEVDISYINMPRKEARVVYKKGEDMQFSSNDFVMLPKRGLDFSLSELFKYSFITVNRGHEKRNGIDNKVVNIIPNDKKADFSIATLYMDVEKVRINSAEISTKNDGTFMISLKYDKDESVLPEAVEVSFEVERVSLPFNFMGKDTQIDRKEMRTDERKTGKIFLSISNYNITKS